MVTAGFLVPVSVEAENEDLSDSGNAFVRFCSLVDKSSKERTDVEDIQIAACASYVLGLNQGIQSEIAFLRVERKDKIPSPYCSSDYSGKEQGQVVRILLKYIRNNPENADSPTAVLFQLAMREAFPPCPSKDN
jgi:hypothetical protein